MKNLVVHKPNELIEIVGNPITAQGLVAYNFILHKFQTEKKDRILISLSEVFNALDMSDNYEELYGYLDSLQRIRVESKDEKGRIWGAFNLLAEFRKLGSLIFFQIPDTIFKALCADDENQKELYYTTIKLLEQRTYKYSYTLIFYEIFKKYEKINIPIYTLDELKELTGTQEKYGEYKDFKRYVLNKALNEINLFDKKYEYSFEEKRLGRKVNEIKFIRNDRNILDVILESQISDKLLNSIEKARKNRFIDKSYSQKSMDKIIKKYDEKDIIKALGELYKYNSEIKSFSKILTAKIEDIKNSKMTKTKENQGHTLGQEEVETPFKSDFTEPKKIELAEKKQEISNLIRNSGLPTNKRLVLMGQLAEIDNLEELDKFIINNLEVNK